MINVEKLLREITPEAPSGEQSLAYDPAFMEFEKKLIEKPEVKNDNGEVIKKALVPDWEEVSESAVELLSRAHDMRVAVYLTRALLHTDGLSGLEHGLQLIHGYLEQYWETFYPQLDPEDNDDPTERINILADLNDYQTVIGPINKITLAAAPDLGTLSVAEIRPASENREVKPGVVDIDAFCTESELEKFQSGQAVAAAGLHWLDKCIALLDEKVGTVNVPQFGALHKVLTDIEKFFGKQLKKLQPDEVGMVEDSVINGTSVGVGGCLTKGIAGRPDVLRALDEICRYYETYEPGSPVPLLLKRAKGLVEKNFVEIIENLVPDSLSQFKKFL